MATLSCEHPGLEETGRTDFEGDRIVRCIGCGWKGVLKDGDVLNVAQSAPGTFENHRSDDLLSEVTV